VHTRRMLQPLSDFNRVMLSGFQIGMGGVVRCCERFEGKDTLTVEGVNNECLDLHLGLL
jgi:hypothetical protein